MVPGELAVFVWLGFIGFTALVLAVIYAVTR